MCLNGLGPLQVIHDSIPLSRILIRLSILIAFWGVVSNEETRTCRTSPSFKQVKQWQGGSGLTAALAAFDASFASSGKAMNALLADVEVP